MLELVPKSGTPLEIIYLVNRYVAEADICPLSAEEILDEYEVLPIREGGECIGFFGVFISDLDMGATAIVEMIYIRPEYRDRKGVKMERHFQQMRRVLERKGIKYLQVDAHPVIAHLIRNRTGLKPVSLRFFAKIGDYEC